MFLVEKKLVPQMKLDFVLNVFEAKVQFNCKSEGTHLVTLRIYLNDVAHPEPATPTYPTPLQFQFYKSCIPGTRPGFSVALNKVDAMIDGQYTQGWLNGMTLTDPYVLIEFKSNLGSQLLDITEIETRLKHERFGQQTKLVLMPNELYTFSFLITCESSELEPVTVWIDIPPYDKLSFEFSFACVEEV
jgi:hypothetical protein